MVLHMISFFLLPKAVLIILPVYILLEGDIEKKKFQLAKWSSLCCPKNQGGLGIHNLEVKNTALLGKWLLSYLRKMGLGKPF
jgi:hypothetical protein